MTRLVMFRPADHPLERGWVGRVEGEHVTQLAAQTLQSFFTGGGRAREHAVYPLAGVRLLAPVLHPPAVRLFEDERSFAFANPAAIHGPGTEIAARSLPGSEPRGRLVLYPRLAGVVGADAEVAGFTLLAEWRTQDGGPPKDRDFALGLGPAVVTGEVVDGEFSVRVDGEERARARLDGFDWRAARDLAAAGTRLDPGDLLGGPPLEAIEVVSGERVEIEAPPIGVLAHVVQPAVEL